MYKYSIISESTKHIIPGMFTGAAAGGTAGWLAARWMNRFLREMKDIVKESKTKSECEMRIKKLVVDEKRNIRIFSRRNIVANEVLGPIIQILYSNEENWKKRCITVINTFRFVKSFSLTATGAVLGMAGGGILGAKM